MMVDADLHASLPRTRRSVPSLNCGDADTDADDSTARSHSRQSTPASASSASATSACRWRSSSLAPASTSPASTSTRRRPPTINAARATSRTCREADCARSCSAGKLRATDRHGAAGRRWTSIDICVPTPLRKTKDPGPVVRRAGASKRWPRRCKPGSWSSSSRRPIRARPTKSCSRCSRPKGLKADVDFFLAFSPNASTRATRSQHAEHPEDRRRRRPREHRGGGGALRAAIVRHVVPVSSTRVAEMVKLLENTFRAVNIGLVNEIALMCHKMDIDVWEVIDAAKTKPFGFMPFYPGPGPRRPLHPDRSVLPVVEGAAERVRVPLHRAGRAGQRVDAANTSSSASRDALNSRAEADQRIARPSVRRGLQARRQRHARVAGARHDGAAGEARRAGRATRIRCVPTLSHGGHALHVDRPRRGDRRDARLRGDLHRPRGVRLRRDREQRHARGGHAQRAASSVSGPTIFRL